MKYGAMKKRCVGIRCHICKSPSSERSVCIERYTDNVFCMGRGFDFACGVGFWSWWAWDDGRAKVRGEAVSEEEEDKEESLTLGGGTVVDSKPIDGSYLRDGGLDIVHIDEGIIYSQ